MAKIGLVPGKPFDITFLKTLVAFDLKVGAFTQELCDEAQKRGWTVISMKRDWKQIFAFQPQAIPRS